MAFTNIPRPIYTRAQAKTLRERARHDGNKYFRTGNPCSRGHVADRLTSTGACVDCQEIHKTKYRESNRGKANSYAKEYRQRNPEKAKTKAAYLQKNRDKRNMYEHKRRAAKRGSCGCYSIPEIRSLFALQKGRCVNCKISIENSYHIDHIMPLSLGGSNDISNIQLLCPRCNYSKNCKHPIEWAQQNGRLF